MTERPEPEWEAPKGYEHVAVEEGGDWRVWHGSRCRYTVNRHGCGRPSAVALRRGTIRKAWWAYCDIPQHAYGRWDEGGKVMHWIVREKGNTGD